MVQYIGRQFRLARDHQPFVVEEADRLFFSCRYLGSRMGFFMEKDVFHRQVARGHILEYRKSLAV